MLVIEYVHEGHQRGYNFTSSTDGYDAETLRAIWRQAMPRGQGWGADKWLGAQSLKAFPVGENRVAVSQVIVTDEVDDAGRRGIRRAEIDVFARTAYLDYLRTRLNSYSAVVRATADRMLTLCQRTRIIEKTLPKFRRDPQLILAHAYSSPASWQVIEAVVLKLALTPLPSMRRWGTIIPFTTLALDHADEGKIVAVPTEKAAQFSAPLVMLR